MAKFQGQLKNIGKVNCSCTNKQETYNKPIEGLSSPPYTVIRVRDEPVSGPSHIDKPPKHHKLVIDEETCISLLRESRSGNQMCAINMQEAGITEEDLEVQIHLAEYYKKKEQEKHTIPAEMVEDMENEIDCISDGDDTVVISDSE